MRSQHYGHSIYRLHIATFIALVMEIVRSFETLVGIYQSKRCNIPEDIVVTLRNQIVPNEENNCIQKLRDSYKLNCLGQSVS